MPLKMKHTAEYLYPGAFFPEETYRELDEPTVSAALRAQPDETGYFKRDGWYAVIIRTSTYKLFHADDGEEEWVKQGDSVVDAKVIVGQQIHVDDIPDEDPDTGRSNTTLKSNLRYNGSGALKGYGVLTRCGNWQLASDYDHVLTVADLEQVARAAEVIRESKSRV